MCLLFWPIEFRVLRKSNISQADFDEDENISSLEGGWEGYSREKRLAAWVRLGGQWQWGTQKAKGDYEDCVSWNVRFPTWLEYSGREWHGIMWNGPTAVKWGLKGRWRIPGRHQTSSLEKLPKENEIWNYRSVTTAKARVNGFENGSWKDSWFAGVTCKIFNNHCQVETKQSEEMPKRVAEVSWSPPPFRY